MAGATFTLRPLERTSGSTGLDQGAFRIHLSAKDLKTLGLAAGDLVRIFTTNTFRGYAIAWPAAQTNPGNKPIAKTTDILREKYGLNLTDPVLIEKANDAWKPSRSISISFSQSLDALNKYSSTEELTHWISRSLEDLEIVLPECTFDVQPKGPKHQGRSLKLRVKIENTEPPLDDTQSPYFDGLDSRITILTEASIGETSKQTDFTPVIDSNGIGGLSDQIKTINKRLAGLPEITTLSNPHLSSYTSFLIHGPEGCGKSLLLKRLSQCPWPTVIRLDQTWLASNRKGQAEALSEDVFKAARAHQPALIVIDDLDKFIKKAAEMTSQLRWELEALEGTQIVVAATARSIYDIDASFRIPSVFKTEIELFAPNVQQREDILRQVLGCDQKITNVDYSSLAERSHGFVGRDIRKLCILARDHRVQQASESRMTEKSKSLNEILESMDFVTQEDFDAVIDQVQPTVLKDSILEVPKVRWSDIAGIDEVRIKIENITVRPYKFPDLDVKFGGPQSRKGVLLYGPPGCAKTLIAQAVATESNQNFLAVKGSELIKMYVGESERAIRDIFRRARAAKPCIIFFDEIDSIGKSREKTQDSGLNVVTTLLNEMDGIEALKDVFIIGATNRPDILDSALIRTGRFDALIHIGLPNEDARRQIFEIHTRKRPLAGDVNLEILASRTEGSSGADIKGLCTVAGENAISDFEKSPDSKPEIRMCHFEAALVQHVPHTIKEEAERYKGWRPGKSLSVG